eukprot:scaffold3827_cov179-Cylindrotheca_fusiformis.AAC.11
MANNLRCCSLLTGAQRASAARICSYWIRHSSSSPSAYSPLIDPSVVYSDNHLLVVNKPPGWHSVPNPEFSHKCILSKLREMRLGGGSKQDFLLPLHRIDQPCSGILMFGKTSKAASRITKQWKKKLVEKHYLAVVHSSTLGVLRRRSMPLSSLETTSGCSHRLEGILQSRNSKDQRSVLIRSPAPEKSESVPRDGRFVSMDWQEIALLSLVDNNPYTVVNVKTNEGARHMVRALLAQAGNCPIEGDLRYNSTAAILPDQSVALHAHRIILDNRLQLGSLKTHEFVAPIPNTWETYFGLGHPAHSSDNVAAPLKLTQATR